MSSVTDMKRMLICAASTLIGIAVLGGLLIGISRMMLQAEWEQTRNELERLKPSAEKLRAAQAAIVSNRKTLSEFQNRFAGIGWPMSGVLRAVQEDVPAQMVLYHFSAGIESPDEKTPLTCALRLSGTARGERIVVEAKQQLNSDPRLRSFCGEIKLISSQRDFGEDWAFAFEGRHASGGPEE